MPTRKSKVALDARTLRWAARELRIVANGNPEGLYSDRSICLREFAAMFQRKAREIEKGKR